MKLPPWDSSIRLSPSAAAFTLDAEVDQELRNKTAVLRKARGSILAFSFQIEHTLDRIIVGFFFPKSVSGNGINLEDLRELFDDAFLKNHAASFSRKIQIFRDIAKQDPVSPVLPPELLAKLDRLRDLRNRFAHYPITFDPSDGKTRDKLIAKLVCRDKEIVLDDNFLAEASKLYSSTQQDLLTIVGSLK